MFINPSNPEFSCNANTIMTESVSVPFTENSNNNNNKNSVITGPAFYFTEDFNTLLQNQQQNPVRSKPIN